MTDFEDLDDLDDLEDEAGGTDVDLTDLLEQTMEVALEKMGGPLIGKIEVYTASTRRASVSPLVPLLADGEIVTPPVLPSVPVCWPSTSGHSLTWPLPKGALVELKPLGHDHSQWITTGTPNVPPPSERRFSISDLVAIPWAPNPLATTVNPLTYDAVWAVLFGAWAIGGSDASKAVALHGDVVSKGSAPADSLALWMTQVESAINTIAPGSVNPLSTTFTKVGTVAATATKLKAK